MSAPPRTSGRRSSASCAASRCRRSTCRGPTSATHAALIAFLESALDRAAAARPQVGQLPLAHRLSRTEYRNAVRDLLGLEALPREASVDYLLPADNIGSGFDNIADLLFVSPSNMERYLDAARKISRLAVGDPAMPVMVNIHRIDPEHPQDERVDEPAVRHARRHRHSQRVPGRRHLRRQGGARRGAAGAAATGGHHRR